MNRTIDFWNQPPSREVSDQLFGRGGRCRQRRTKMQDRIPEQLGCPKRPHFVADDGLLLGPDPIRPLVLEEGDRFDGEHPGRRIDGIDSGAGHLRLNLYGSGSSALERHRFENGNNDRHDEQQHQYLRGKI